MESSSVCTQSPHMSVSSPSPSPPSMCIGNPFILGWSPEMYGCPLSSPDPISIYGALPYPHSPTSSPPFITLRFTSLNPTILNCIVLGPMSRPFYHITTDPDMPDYSVLKTVQGKNMALIEWQSRPFVEVRGVLPKQGVYNWLKLSADKRSRSMEVRGTRYTWAPCDHSVCLYDSDSGSSVHLARILNTDDSVVLEVSSQAIHLGLLEHCVTATLLLQCGRNID